MVKKIRIISIYILTLLIVSVSSNLLVHASEQNDNSICYIEDKYYDDIESAILDAKENDTIILFKDLEINSPIIVNSKNISIKGKTGNESIKRGQTLLNNIFSLSNGSTLTLENITLDGSAVWSDPSLTLEAVKNRTNLGVVAKSAFIKIENSTLNLLAGTTIQNCYIDNQIDAGAIFARKSLINIYDGAIIQDCVANSGDNYAGGIYCDSTKINMEGGIFRRCAAMQIDSNSGAAMFIRDSSTLEMKNNSVISDCYNAEYGALTARESNIIMRNRASVVGNEGKEGAAILGYTSSNIEMRDDALITNNIANGAGNVYISGNTHNPNAASGLSMFDNSSIQNNSAVKAGAVYLSSGEINMFDNSLIQNNIASDDGGGIFSVGNTYINLFSSKILNNKAGKKGDAIFHNGKELNLNASNVKIDNSIYLAGTNNENAKTISLIGIPVEDHKYILDTDETGTFEGRDVVRVGCINMNGEFYSVEDASHFQNSFTHLSLCVNKGAYYYGSLNDHSHDSYLVLVNGFDINIDETIKNGSILTDKEKATSGEIVSLSINAEEEYEIESLKVKNDKTGEEIVVSNGMFIMPDSSVTISATFLQKTYNVIINDNILNGIIKTDIDSAAKGEKVFIEIMPEKGYFLNNLIVINQDTNESILISNNTFIMPNADVIITASFEMINDQTQSEDSTNLSKDSGTQHKGVDTYDNSSTQLYKYLIMISGFGILFILKKSKLN